MKREKKSYSVSPDEAMRHFRKNNDIGALARKTGHSHNVLLDRLNPERDQKLGYLEAIGHSHLTNDISLLKAWADDVGYGVFKLPEGSSGDEEILDLFLLVQQSAGNFAGCFVKAREDGVIEPKEASELIAIANEQIGSLTRLLEEIKSQVRTIENKPDFVD